MVFFTAIEQQLRHTAFKVLMIATGSHRGRIRIKGQGAGVLGKQSSCDWIDHYCWSGFAETPGSREPPVLVGVILVPIMGVCLQDLLLLEFGITFEEKCLKEVAATTSLIKLLKQQLNTPFWRHKGQLQRTCYNLTVSLTKDGNGTRWASHTLRSQSRGQVGNRSYCLPVSHFSSVQ